MTQGFESLTEEQKATLSQAMNYDLGHILKVLKEEMIQSYRDKLENEDVSTYKQNKGALKAIRRLFNKFDATAEEAEDAAVRAQEGRNTE